MAPQAEGSVWQMVDAQKYPSEQVLPAQHGRLRVPQRVIRLWHIPSRHRADDSQTEPGQHDAPSTPHPNAGARHATPSQDRPVTHPIPGQQG
jgi:hypothetical protein